MRALLALATAPLVASGQGLPSRSAIDRAEPILLEIRIADAASATIQAQRAGDSAFVPARGVCELAELRCSSVGDEYISMEAVASMLHAHVDLDWPQLTVLVTECDALPVMRRRARVEAHTALLDRKKPEQLRPDFVARTPAAVSPSVRIDYIMFATASSIASASHSFSIATPILRGTLSARIALIPGATTTGGFTAALHPSTIGASWLRVWNGAQPVRQLRLGDVPAAEMGTLRGVSITNEPYASDGTDSVNVTGTTSPGREVYAYRDGALVDATTAATDGSYHFWLPSVHGYNSFTLSSYGSFGEESLTHRSIYVPPGMLPPHSLRYLLSAGRCLSSTCGLGTDVTVSYALLDRITATISLVGATSRDAVAFLSITSGLVARVTDALSTSILQTGNSSTLVSAHFTPGPTFDLVGSFRSARVDGAGPSALSQHDPQYAGPHSSGGEVSASWRPRVSGRHLSKLHADFFAHIATLRSASSSTTTASTTSASTTSASTTTAQFGVTLPLALVYVAPFALYTESSNARLTTRRTVAVGLDATFSQIHRPSFIAGSIIRLNARTRSYARPSLASATVSIPARGSLMIEAQASSSGGRPALSLGVREWIHGFRVASTINRSVAGRPRTSHTLDGSFVLDLHRGRLNTRRASLLGSARITGVVFADRNRNGRRDAGEQSIPGVYVRTRDGGALSDSTGEYEILDVEPFAPALLQVDPLTLASPLLAPLHRSIRVEAVPDEVVHLDIPIVDTATIAASDATDGKAATATPP